VVGLRLKGNLVFFYFNSSSFYYKATVDTDDIAIKTLFLADHYASVNCNIGSSLFYELIYSLVSTIVVEIS